MVADEKLFAGYLLSLEKNRLACAGINDSVSVDGIDTEHRCGDDLFLFALVFFYNLRSFGFSYALNDNLLSALRAESAERLCFDFGFNRAAEGVFLAYRLCVRKRNFKLGVCDLFNYVLDSDNLYVLLCGVENYFYIAVLAYLSFERICKSRLYFFNDVLLRDSLFLYENIKRREKFCVHFC